MTKARDLASAAPAPSTVSATEIGYLDGVSSAIQTQIDGKSGTSHNHNSDYIAKTLTTTTGDIIYASSANTPARLGIGSTGNVLTVSGGIPSWSAPGSSGKVLQVVTSTTTTQTTNTSTTFADSGLSASITPSSASSKILVLTNQVLLVVRVSSNGRIGRIRLMRDSTEISGNTADSEMLGISVNVNSGQDIRMASGFSYTYLDSPSTTSSVTYKTQIAVQASGASGETTAQFQNAKGSIVLLEIGA